MVLDINDKSGEALLQGDTVPHRSVVSNKSERLLHAIHDPEVEEAPSECLVGPSTAVRQAIFDLFDGRVTFHKAAIDKLVDQFDLEELRDINLQEEIDKIEAHNFYSSHGDLKALLGNDKEKAERERYREGLRQLISRIWRREGRVFLKVPAFGNVKGGFSSYMGVRCARILRPDDAEEIQDRASICQRLIKYQILFLLATHEAIAKKDGHRRAYFWAQMGALTVNELREKHSSEGEDAVVLAMKDKSDDQVRAYLDAMLSLIFPDKANMKMNDVGQMLIFDLFQEAEWRLKKGDNTLHDFVQEHFITSQLITLARARGLWAEYGCYLEKLLQARKDQFINNFHLRPIGPKEGERHTERKISLLELIANYYYNNDERLPSMASLGCGDCQLELFLSRLGFIEGPFKGVDLFDDENEDELYLEMPYEKNEVYRFNNKYRGEEGFADEVLKKMGSADLIFAGDVVHETEDPSRYFLGAYDAVNPGGYMVVSDPIHCSAVDQVTSVSVNRFDSTEYPNSMLDLEKYYEMIAYLTVQGARIVQVAILPGAYAGYNDSFWRISIIVQKPAEGEMLPYELPKEDKYENGCDPIFLDEDIFKVWPLTEIKDPDDRDRLIQKIHAVVGCDIPSVLIGETPKEKRHLRFENIKYHLIKWLLPRDGFNPNVDILKQEKDLADNLISENGPCKEFIDDFKELFGRNRELEQKNHYAGEVVTLVNLLYSECQIDLRGLVADRVSD